MADPVGIRYEGLRELAQALKETDNELLNALKHGLEEVGEVVELDARERFEKYDAFSAENFETRVRAGGKSAAIVVVGQRLRKTTGLRSDFGALQVTHALLPAQDAKAGESADICEREVFVLLKQHGF